MMKIFIHRVNQSSDLLKIPSNFGVEIDIRTSGKEIILSHDPFSSGELFTDWLKSWKGQPLILNVKEDSLESSLLSILSKHQVPDYFFLDQSYPSIRKMVGSGNSNLASRVSDFEDLETALNSGSDWVWLDSFSGNWRFLQKAVPAIKSNQQKVCLVSPELHRPDSDAELLELQELIKNLDTGIDAVCTKFPNKWAS
jgi:hypothetical protein